MACSQNQAVFALRRSELKLKLELVEEKQKLLDIRERKENAREVGTHRRKFRLCRGWNHSQTPAKRCQFEQFQELFSSNDITCEEVKSVDSQRFSSLDTSYVRATREPKKKKKGGTVESTDTIVKLKTKIENSSTFESDPDFVKTLIQNCIDERVSQNEREVTSEQKIELAKLQLAKLEKEIELQLAKNKALSLNPAAKVEEKQFETNIENMINKADHIKEIPITYGYTQDPFKNRSQNFRPKIKENYPQYLEKEKIIALYAVIHLIAQETVRSVFKPKESNDHIHNKINVNTLKIESEKQNSDECANLQYVNIFVENQPVTALIDSGCQIPVLNSSLIRVQTPSEEIITLSSCFGEQRMVEVKPINISLNQHSLLA
ncbi:hypothetical protein TNCV_1641371 [Trichonephila clavipes]|nr:hypothetical protein TNCV_1641371 [Trichonephila clavipes]